MYTKSIAELQGEKIERQYRRVVWSHPLISVFLAAGVVAVLSFNGFYA